MYRPILRLSLLVSFLFHSIPAYTHGEGNWNDFMINNKNNQVATALENLKGVIADITLERRPVTSWPDPELQQARNNLLAMEEEVAAMLDHLREEDGIYLQINRVLREHPQAGRSVAGSYAVEVGIELIEYILSLQDHRAFESDLHEDGKGAYLFDLMDAYLDTMGVYERLEQSQRRAAELDTAWNNRTLGQDFIYHLRRLLLWLGLTGWADALKEDPADLQETAPEIIPGGTGEP
jgi:hypothetical protein